MSNSQNPSADLGLEYSVANAVASNLESLCLELKAKLRKVPEFIPMEHLSDSKPACTFEVVRELLMAVYDACQYIAHLEVQHKFVNCTAEITKCVRSALIEAGMTDMEFIVTAQKNNDEYFSKRVNELRNMSIDEWADFGRYMNELEEQISQAS